MSTSIKMKYLSALLVPSAALILSACGGGSEQTAGQGSGSLVAAAKVPNALGQWPDSNGYYPDENGRYPNSKGQYPDANGRYPDHQGNYPDEFGRYPDYRGLYPDENGRYPDHRGIYANPNGTYPNDADAGIIKNASGWARTYSTTGVIDRTNPFFKPLGNGRSCSSCHEPGDGFTVNPKSLQERFDRTNGMDPIFRVNDGSNSPLAPVGTLEERRAAYSMLLKRGVIRIGLPIPAGAEFELVSVDDPYGYASANELSLFRRVLPSTNLKFLGAVMWDNRETLQLPRSASPYCQNASPTAPCFEWPFNNNLKRQANGATTGHAQFAQGLTDAEQNAIVDFELSLFTAQEYDNTAKFLSAARAKGSTRFLSKVDYYFDINGFLDPKTGLPGDKFKTMQVFVPWATNPGTNDAAVAAARASIARGEVIFNTKTFTMVGVAGTNGTTVTGATCTNCHKSPDVGTLSVPNSFNIGVADPAWMPRDPELPLYTLRNIQTTGANVGKVIQTSDPGMALITGKWGDIGKVKTTGLRGLASRAPYFHNGSAKTIEETTDFYIRRFNMNLTAQEYADLNAYLKSL